MEHIDVPWKSRARVLKVIQHILEEPKRVHMTVYVAATGKGFSQSAPPCGTVACVAGWFALTGPRAKAYQVRLKTMAARRRVGGVQFYASGGPVLSKRVGDEFAKALGVPRASAAYRQVVSVYDWPSPWRNAYLAVASVKGAAAATMRANIVAERFCHLLSHHE